MLDDISTGLSQRILAMLIEDGMTMNEIAKEAGTTVAFLQKVKAGLASLKQKHLEKLDEAHPGLPFRIGREMVIENAAKIGRKGRKAAKSIQEKGESAVDKVGRKLRHGAWALLNKTLSGDD